MARKRKKRSRKTRAGTYRPVRRPDSGRKGIQQILMPALIILLTVLEILAGNHAEIVSFASGLNDDELDRTGYLAATGDVSIQQIIEYVVFMSAGEHIANIKNTLNIT